MKAIYASALEMNLLTDPEAYGEGASTTLGQPDNFDHPEIGLRLFRPALQETEPYGYQVLRAAITDPTLNGAPMLKGDTLTFPFPTPCCPVKPSVILSTSATTAPQGGQTSPVRAPQGNFRQESVQTPGTSTSTPPGTLPRAKPRLGSRCGIRIQPAPGPLSTSPRRPSR